MYVPATGGNPQRPEKGGNKEKYYDCSIVSGKFSFPVLLRKRTFSERGKTFVETFISRVNVIRIVIPDESLI